MSNQGFSAVEFKTYIKNADHGKDFKVSDFKLIPFTMNNPVLSTANFVVSFITCITEPGSTDSHNVVISFNKSPEGESIFNIWCSDKFLEGKSRQGGGVMTEEEARTRCESAVENFPNKSKLVTKLMESFNILSSPQERCNFWTNFRKKKELCSHTATALAHLRDNRPDFMSEMETAYNEYTSGEALGAVLGDTFSLTELAFRVPVLFEGDRGAGKTHDARAFARSNNYRRVEFGGHEGMESPDMLGYLVPMDSKSMVWKDGPLSEAFRAAKTQKTVLIIDEMLRIRQRELSILLTALSPDEGKYRVRTGRIKEVIDGVAIEEELECPVENLCVVATTNVGSEYAVDDIDPALAERFVVIRKDTSPVELKRILGGLAKAKKLPEKIATQCVDFFNKMTEARLRGVVNHAPTTRTLARAIELAKDKDDVKRAIKTQILLWVARTAEGRPVDAQISDVEKLIDRCFK